MCFLYLFQLPIISNFIKVAKYILITNLKLLKFKSLFVIYLEVIHNRDL